MHCIVRGSKGLVLFQCQYLDPVLYTSEARALNRAPIVDHAIAHFLVPYLDNKILNMERLSFDQPPPSPSDTHSVGTMAKQSNSDQNNIGKCQRRSLVILVKFNILAWFSRA